MDEVGANTTLHWGKIISYGGSDARVFQITPEGDHGKMNLSVLETGGEALVVSQFTLYADTRKGRRPSFTDAALPEVASPLVERFAALLSQQGIPTQTGEFAAHMQVEIHNDGPVTIILER